MVFSIDVGRSPSESTLESDQLDQSRPYVQGGRWHRRNRRREADLRPRRFIGGSDVA